MGKYLASVDLTLNELRTLGKVKPLHKIFEFLDLYWYSVKGKIDENRTKSVRLGTLEVGTNDDGNLIFKFTTRFSLVKHLDALEKLFLKD